MNRIDDIQNKKTRAAAGLTHPTTPLLRAVATSRGTIAPLSRWGGVIISRTEQENPGRGVEEDARPRKEGCTTSGRLQDCENRQLPRIPVFLQVIPEAQYETRVSVSKINTGHQRNFRILNSSIWPVRARTKCNHWQIRTVTLVEVNRYTALLPHDVQRKPLILLPGHGVFPVLASESSESGKYPFGAVDSEPAHALSWGSQSPHSPADGPPSRGAFFALIISQALHCISHTHSFGRHEKRSAQCRNMLTRTVGQCPQSEAA